MAAFVNTTLCRWLSISIWTPDAVLVALIYLGLTSGSRVAVIAGFLVGIYQDLYVPNMLGQHALAKTCIGYAAGVLSDKISVEHLPIQTATVFSLAVFHELFMAVSAGGSPGAMISRFFIRGLPSAVYTALFALILVGLFGAWLLPKEWGQARFRGTRRAR